MMVLPRKDPPTLKTRRSTGEPYYTPVDSTNSYYGHELRPGGLRNCEPFNWIVKADQSPKRYSAWWLIWIAISWIGLLGFLIYIFSN